MSGFHVAPVSMLFFIAPELAPTISCVPASFIVIVLHLDVVDAFVAFATTAPFRPKIKIFPETLVIAAELHVVLQVTAVQFFRSMPSRELHVAPLSVEM